MATLKWMRPFPWLVIEATDEELRGKYGTAWWFAGIASLFINVMLWAAIIVLILVGIPV
ncbi:MAG: hypothetical protein WC248_00365 [Candidatus Methanomethylophilaceae archaeon]|jgi:hypothetical protein